MVRRAPPIDPDQRLLTECVFRSTFTVIGRRSGGSDSDEAATQTKRRISA